MRLLPLLLTLAACAHHTTGHEALQAVDAYQRASDVQPAPAPDAEAEDWCALDDAGCAQLARERLAALLPALATLPPDAARAEVALVLQHVLPVADWASTPFPPSRRAARWQVCHQLPEPLRDHPRCPTEPPAAPPSEASTLPEVDAADFGFHAPPRGVEY